MTTPHDVLCSTASQKSKRLMRDSNMELLRIVAMLLVMVVHADFVSLGRPSADDVLESPVGSIGRLGVQAVSIICVNVFVLLSGWYGIKAKWKGVASFLFQVLFFSILCIVAHNCLIVHLLPPPIVEIASTQNVTIASSVLSTVMINFEDYWFVKAYLFLYILSPALNAYVSQAPRLQFRNVLLLFFSLQFLYGWYYGSVGYFANGYSTTSFIGLYLLARYIKLYSPAFAAKEKWTDAAMYVLLTAITTVFAFFCARNGRSQMYDALYKYNSPLVIAASLSFLLFFSKTRLQSRFVNTIAISAFAVYLLHGHTLIYNCYCKTIKMWHDTLDTPQFLVNVSMLIVSLFVMAVLIDKARILAWNGITRFLYNRKA